MLVEGGREGGWGERGWETGGGCDLHLCPLALAEGPDALLRRGHGGGGVSVLLGVFARRVVARQVPAAAGRRESKRRGRMV
eukprot:1021809-Rhodomonas_salina.1